jgi:hypothetical protein
VLELVVEVFAVLVEAVLELVVEVFAVPILPQFEKIALQVFLLILQF